MSEGGIYPWKIQKIQHPKNGKTGSCRYSDLKRPLPEPPKGQTWFQDERSREWKLVPVASGVAGDVVADISSIVNSSAGLERAPFLVTAAAIVEALPVATIEPLDVDENNSSSISTTQVCTAVPVTLTQISAMPASASSTNEVTTNGILYHEVLPTDTFQGICLKYKITPTELRRANKMMGSNLSLAP